MDVNCLANIYLYSLFLPLIKNGKEKKVICISSAQGDAEWAKDYEIHVAALYSASKAAMNMITSKFHAQYKKDGILFMGICPGMVDVGHFTHGMCNFCSGTQPQVSSLINGLFVATPEQMQGLQEMLSRFAVYSPNFKGPDTPYDSIQAVMKVINNSTVEKDGGAFLSHFGNKQWI